VIRLNTGEPEDQQLMADCDLVGHPALAVMDDDGKVVQRLPGAHAETVLRQAIATFLEPNG
jgi:thiol:disulfide interchange protein